jgi:hypothetical protein
MVFLLDLEVVVEVLEVQVETQCQQKQEMAEMDQVHLHYQVAHSQVAVVELKVVVLQEEQQAQVGAEVVEEIQMGLIHLAVQPQDNQEKLVTQILVVAVVEVLQLLLELQVDQELLS